MGRTSSSPPVSPVPPGITGASQLAPRLIDFQKSGSPGAAENRQLWLSAFEFGSAPPPPFSATLTLVPKLAAAGGVGGAKALAPLLCFVNQVLVMQTLGSQSGVRLSGKAMLAFPSGSVVIV